MFILSHSFVLLCIIAYKVVCFVCFCLILYIMYSYCYIMCSDFCLCILIVIYSYFYVYIFLLLCMFCVICFIVLFYVLFVCKCVLYYCHRDVNPIAVNKYISVIEIRIPVHLYILLAFLAFGKPEDDHVWSKHVAVL